MKGLEYDAKIAAYVLNPIAKYNLENIISEYLEIDVANFISSKNNSKMKDQINLFDTIGVTETNNEKKLEQTFYVYNIYKLEEKTTQKLNEIGSLELFKNIEMPLVEILGDMQFNGMQVEKEELIEFGDKLKQNLEILTNEIYNLCGETFNINSTQQLGNILFEKLKLPVYKKTKTGYSTDVDILEKLKLEHPVIENTFIFSSNSNSNRKNKFFRSKSSKHTNKNRTWKEVKKSI